MGIYIKGMEMPKSCCECPVNMEVCKRGYEYLLEHPELYDNRADDCPLIEVPTPHGRLIDADSLIDAIESTDWYHQAPNKEMVHGANSAEHQAWYKEQDVYSVVENAPTIIEKEDGT